ncbi:MAG TPA: Holliday junction resolvase RuvX [Pelolinea sp.]|nr:Holliday junction resolvase RuvX [Pelolinea sp.]
MDEPSRRKVLAVDWGSKRIGLAVSDSSATIAKPLCVIEHTSRKTDALSIIKKSLEVTAEIILVGVTYNDENLLTPSGRSAKRLAEEISKNSPKEIILWDEGFTTNDAKDLMFRAGKSRKKRQGHVDDIAAAVFLQKFLDSRKE